QIQKDKLKLNEHATIQYPNAKDTNRHDARTVYLQPDKTVKTSKEKNWVGREKVYKKGLST
ncbi:hypothetical protein, partial [Enterococcus faecalis]|uniref:hypothetical protein n=1 Tax=Enterococcus faecalis TaxID=1351 RepID=UPI0021DF95C9